MREFAIIAGAALAFSLAVFLVAMALNKLGWIKTASLKDEDKDWIPDAVEKEIQELNKQLYNSYKRIKELNDKDKKGNK